MAAKPTSARPKIIDGVAFRCYQSGVAAYYWQSDDARIVARGNHFRSVTYSAFVDKKIIGQRYRSIENAMRAGVKAAK